MPQGESRKPRRDAERDEQADGRRHGGAGREDEDEEAESGRRQARRRSRGASERFERPDRTPLDARVHARSSLERLLDLVGFVLLRSQEMKQTMCANERAKRGRPLTVRASRTRERPALVVHRAGWRVGERLRSTLADSAGVCCARRKTSRVSSSQAASSRCASMLRSSRWRARRPPRQRRAKQVSIGNLCTHVE